jgi:ERCC4-type nuclease
MILIDYRKGGEGKDKNTPQLMVDTIKRLGVHSELSDLAFGDAAFEGRGPLGTISVGIERKTLHDILHCIDDARLSGHQLVGMRQMYTVRVVLLEGFWKPHDPEGWLMEGFNGGTSWAYCRYGSQRTLYSKLYRYLISVSLSGAIVTYSRDLFQTCYNIHEWYHYFQKRWDGHTSLQELQKVNIPTLNFRPSLTRLWAHDVQGVGMKLSELAERHFKTPIRLANADETEWLKVPGVGVKTAQNIVREIWGQR